MVRDRIVEYATCAIGGRYSHYRLCKHVVLSDVSRSAPYALLKQN